MLTEPFGLYENETHTIGCGYDSAKKEVFFVKDGIKLAPAFPVEFESLTAAFPVEFESLTAAFTIEDFEWLEINYGQKMFVFNLLEEYDRNNYI